MKTDILIVGSGCSGLYCALKCPSDKNILLISKSDLESSDSYLAQGGICMLKDDQDYESYFEDTMKAGHYENDKESVGIMIRSSQDVIRDLISYGTQFESDPEGQFLFTKEGAHSDKRILFHDDVTGQEITSHLLEEVKKRENVTLMEFTTMVDIVEKDNVCYGAVLRLKDGSLDVVDADYVVLACGGIGGLYEHSTNYSHLTGDALAIALRHNVALKNTNYVQIHPTTFYTEKNEERSFLISESVRGEGAVLLDKNMERFTDELQPRDLLSKAILEQMKKDGTKHVWEDLRPIPRDELFKHFPNIIKHCKEMGYDVTKEPIPVVPAQHYFMGGIQVDHASRTTMEQLYAVGETSNNGVHGRNRLASNSLLESLVFAKRAAVDIAEKYPAVKRDESIFENFSLEQYSDSEKLRKEYEQSVILKIELDEILNPTGVDAEKRSEEHV
ncbi:MAG: L-aspartate oxidase [Clostridia bacterium]|nr:L-aspartate oxidase [Clostridia bacterium]